jgi:hypothetical protein
MNLVHAMNVVATYSGLAKFGNVLIVTILFNHISVFFNFKNNYQFILRIVNVITSVILIFLVALVMYKVMLPLWSTNTESTFLNEYRKIIKRMLDK